MLNWHLTQTEDTVREKRLNHHSQASYPNTKKTQKTKNSARSFIVALSQNPLGRIIITRLSLYITQFLKIVSLRSIHIFFLFIIAMGKQRLRTHVVPMYQVTSFNCSVCPSNNTAKIFLCGLPRWPLQCSLI